MSGALSEGIGKEIGMIITDPIQARYRRILTKVTTMNKYRLRIEADLLVSSDCAHHFSHKSVYLLAMPPVDYAKGSAYK